jgi:CBS domain-containing protein
VKVEYNSDKRVVMIEPDTSLSEFRKRVEEKIGRPGICIRWRDPDGDQVLLADDEDLRFAIEESGGKLEVQCADA